MASVVRWIVLFGAPPQQPPDVQQHELANPSADSDGEQMVALPSVGVQRQIKIRCCRHCNANDCPQHWAFLQGLDRSHEHSHFNGEGYCPDCEECSNGWAAAGVCIA